MTIKDMETEEAHLSSNISAAARADSSHMHNLNTSTNEASRDRQRSWGWMLSGIICVNILILGCALVSGSAYNTVNITTADLQIYLILLLLFTTGWMIYYVIYTSRNEEAVTYKDDHAGPIWLRGGLVLFGLLSIIMDIFKIAAYVGYLHCDSAVKVAFPVVQFIFIIVQTYFMWVHAKDCVQLQRNISRCGLMLTLSTNLVLWMTLVTEESLHQTDIPEEPHINSSKTHGRNAYIRASYGDDDCKCSHTSCSMFKEAYYYLYPFNIEYSLFASAMAYVMWKNVGRLTAEHGHHGFKFNLREVLLSSTAGVLLVVAGLATFIVYEMDMKGDHDDDTHSKAVMMHFTMNIVIVTLMSASTVLGCAIYRLDPREHVSDKNPTRSLDVGLLVGASLGQFIISYFTIVAMVGTGAKGYLNRLNLTWAIMMVIQLGLQNFFIIEGLHREPLHEEHHEEVQLPAVVANPYVLQPTKDLHFESAEMAIKSNPMSDVQHSLHGHGMHAVHGMPGMHGVHGMPGMHGMHAIHGLNAEHGHTLPWKRRVLKEVCMFLLLGNVILWIMPAFGARPQFDHDTETEFYKFNMWAAVVNIGLPFGIFYRMHSVASLFEVLVMA